MIGAGIVMLAVAVVLSLGPGAHDSQWRTDFGPLTLSVDEDGTVSGTYPDYDGRVVARLESDARTISGHWFQPESDQPCASARDGTRAWGRVVWWLEGPLDLVGRWSYCDSDPEEARSWNGEFEAGTHPLATQ